MSKKLDVLKAMADRVKSQPRDENGQWIAKGAGLAKTGVELGATKGVGFLGKAAGEAILPGVGGIVGGALGAAAGRAVGKTVTAAFSAASQVQQDERYEEFSILEKLQKTTQLTLEEMSSPAFQKELRQAMTTDIEGAVLGGLGAIGAGAGLDFMQSELVGGMAAGMLGTQATNALRKRGGRK